MKLINYKPILFSTPMVKAILEGRKTMTRRIIKYIDDDMKYLGHWQPDMDNIEVYDFKSSLGKKTTIKPKYKKGDVLWVKETFTKVYNFKSLESGEKILKETYIYKADDDFHKDNITNWEGWKPSLFMPKSACRIFLKITDIRVEKLNIISKNDAIKEGIEIGKNEKCSISGKMYKTYKNYITNKFNLSDARVSFLTLWQSINDKNFWNNPYVWVISFERIEKPIDFN
jgi:hypothetical protein